MAEQALYRKYRPQNFAEIVGQEHVTVTLQNALQEGRIAHAYMFSGPRGTGKTSAARILAKAVNCLNEDIAARPDNSCPMCVAVNEGRSLDLIEIDAASHTGVDNIREMIDRVNLMPSEGRYKVYVIDEVHMLSTSAFNALLKTLEEPPAHVIFILATTEPHKVLPTVLSRCQRFSFRRIPEGLIRKELRRIAELEDIDVEDAALARMARHANGGMRDAVSLLDQLVSSSSGRLTLQDVNEFLGAVTNEAMGVLVDALAERDTKKGLAQLNALRDQGVDMQQLAAQMVGYLRDLLLWKVGGETALPEHDDAYRQQLSLQTQKLAVSQLSRLIRDFSRIRTDVRGGMEPHVAMELTFVDAASVTTAGARPATVEEKAAPYTPAATAPAARPRARQTPPAPAERRPTAPVSAPAAGTAVQLDENDPLAGIRRNWKMVGHFLRRQKLYRLQAGVNSSIPVRLEGQRLFIDFQNELSYNLATKERRQVERAVQQIFGKAFKIVCLLQGRYEEGTVDVSAPQEKRTSTTKANDNMSEIANDPLIKAVLTEGGRIVKIHKKGNEATDG